MKTSLKKGLLEEKHCDHNGCSNYNKTCKNNQQNCPPGDSFPCRHRVIGSTLGTGWKHSSLSWRVLCLLVRLSCGLKQIILRSFCCHGIQSITFNINIVISTVDKNWFRSRTGNGLWRFWKRRANTTGTFITVPTFNGNTSIKPTHPSYISTSRWAKLW